MIAECLLEIVSRERVGDWEGDSIMGQGHRTGFVSVVEQQSRYCIWFVR